MSDNSKKLNAAATRHSRAVVMALVAAAAATSVLAGCSTATSTVSQPPS